MVFLDTNPCISAYRSSDPSGWDPCGSDIPGPADCLFHKNIVAQSCATQQTWLLKTLAAIPAGDWKIVVGHHPADEIDVEDMTTALQQAKIDLYLNGHTHGWSACRHDGPIFPAADPRPQPCSTTRWTAKAPTS